MVLLSLFLGNDLRWQSRDLLSYSYLAATIRFLIAVHTKFEGQIVHGAATYADDGKYLTDAAYLDLEKARSSSFLKDNEQFDRDFAGAWSYIKEMKHICEQRGISLVVVVIPDEVQVNEELKQGVIAAYGSRAQFLDFKRPNTRLAEKFRENAIDYIDLLDNFADVSKKVRLYKPNDTHWNILGNRMAANIISQHLLAEWR